MLSAERYNQATNVRRGITPGKHFVAYQPRGPWLAGFLAAVDGWWIARLGEHLTPDVARFRLHCTAVGVSP